MGKFFQAQKKILSIGLIGIFLFFFGCYAFAFNALAIEYQQNTSCECEGDYCLPNPLAGTCSVAGVIGLILGYIKPLAIVIAVFLLILAGFRFVTAQGNEEKIKTARRNLVWTIVGIAVVVAADLILGIIQDVLGVEGAAGQWSALYEKLLGFLNQIITIIFVLATVYFVWGVAEYVRSAGNEKALEQGKRHMIYGIIGMAIMGGAWGIVTIIMNSLGLQ